MISSPSAQIVNAIAESISISAVGGPSVPAYGPTMGECMNKEAVDHCTDFLKPS